MRDGAILGTTPRALREETGEDDLGQAFLAMIRGRPRDRAGHGRDGAAGPVADPAGPPDGGPAARGARRAARPAALRLRRPARRLPGRSARRCAASSRSSSMFLVTSIAMLRERTSGTLERLMTLPLAKADLLAGYALAFGAARRRAGGRRLPLGFAGLGLARRTASGSSACWRSATRVLGHGARAVRRARSPARSSRPSSSCRRSSSRSCCCAGCSSRARRWRPLLHAISWALPFTYAYDALARATRAGPLGARPRDRRRGDLRRHARRPGPRRLDVAQAHRMTSRVCSPQR